nr:chaperone modulator CbpM [uncultured Dyadobacter sp.]
MENDQLVAIEAFCSYYGVEYSFLESLQDHELIETVIVGEARFLHTPHLNRIERMVRLHHDLAINAEGIGAVQALLDRIDFLEKEMGTLRNKLRFYEPSRQ